MSRWWHTIKGAGAISTQGPGFNPGLYQVTYGKRRKCCDDCKDGKKGCDEE